MVVMSVRRTNPAAVRWENEERGARARSAKVPRRAGGGTGQLGGQDLPTVSLMTPEGLKVKLDNSVAPREI